MLPIPAIEMSKQDLRPILSGRGAQRRVTTRLMTEIKIVRRAEVVGSSCERRLTEYIIMLLMPG
jgi:hypothetical protein